MKTCSSKLQKQDLDNSWWVALGNFTRDENIVADVCLHLEWNIVIIQYAYIFLLSKQRLWSARYECTMCSAHISFLDLKTLVGRSGLSGNLSRWATESVAGGDISSRPSRPKMHLSKRVKYFSRSFVRQIFTHF